MIGCPITVYIVSLQKSCGNKIPVPQSLSWRPIAILVLVPKTSVHGSEGGTGNELKLDTNKNGGRGSRKFDFSSPMSAALLSRIERDNRFYTIRVPNWLSAC